MDNLGKIFFTIIIILMLALICLTVVFINEKNATEKNMIYVVENSNYISELYKNIIDENYDISTIDAKQFFKY